MKLKYSPTFGIIGSDKQMKIQQLVSFKFWYARNIDAIANCVKSRQEKENPNPRIIKLRTGSFRIFLLNFELNDLFWIIFGFTFTFIVDLWNIIAMIIAKMSEIIVLGTVLGIMLF